jgi:hypothetical protein
VDLRKDWNGMRYLKPGKALLLVLALGLVIIAEPRPAACAKSKGQVVAKGDHWEITAQELDQRVGRQLALMEVMIYRAKMRALYEMVDRHLIEEAAKKEKLTPEEYLKKEVDEKVTPPTDEVVRKYYDDHKQRFSAPFEKVKDEIKTQLTQLAIAKRRTQFVAELRKKAKVTINLPAPKVMLGRKTPPAPAKAPNPNPESQSKPAQGN